MRKIYGIGKLTYEDLRRFIRYGNHSTTFASHPDDDESDSLYMQFISFIADVRNGEAD